MQLCALRKQADTNAQLVYEAGSIESLLNLVDTNAGITLVPELAVRTFNKERIQQVHKFVAPEPVREISIVATHSIWKHQLRDLLKGVITQKVLPLMNTKAEKGTIVPVTSF
jgi:LysR family hydrogen peroxide-inducible transcriptional activator